MPAFKSLVDSSRFSIFKSYIINFWLITIKIITIIFPLGLSTIFKT